MKRTFLTGAALIAVATITIGGSANAGLTISDKRFWPNEAGPMAVQKAEPAPIARGTLGWGSDQQTPYRRPASKPKRKAPQ